MRKKLVTVFLGIMASIAVMTACGDTSTTSISNNQAASQNSGNEESAKTELSNENSDNKEPSEEMAKDIDFENIETSISNMPKYDFDQVSKKENVDFSHIASMMDYISANGKDDNIVLSDLSLNMAMGMLSLGADGETYDVLKNYFNEDIDNKAKRDGELVLAYNGYEDATVLLSNSVFADKKMPLREDYIDTIKGVYYSIAETLDFHANPEYSASVINKWCAENTKNMIKEIITPAVLAERDVILLNALYFNGKWADPFEDNQISELTFHNNDGTTTLLDGMEEYGLTVYESDNAIAFEKRYEGYDFAFYGIVPNADIVDENGNFNMKDIDITTLVKNPNYRKEAHIILPKFKVSDDNTLSAALKNEGLENIFEYGVNSNFSKMCDCDLVVSDVIQKTVVEVDEEGTKASAITSIEMANDACAIENMKEVVDIILDRPFAFIIYDNAHDEILFIGKMVNMNSIEK